MIPVPGGGSFMMPVALVRSLYRRHTGYKAVGIAGVPDGLDVTASRSGNHIYLHIVNINRNRPITARIAVRGMKIESGLVIELAGDPEYEVIQTQSNEVSPAEKRLPSSGNWTFPAASVSAVELNVKSMRIENA